MTTPQQLRSFLASQRHGAFGGPMIGLLRGVLPGLLCLRRRRGLGRGLVNGLVVALALGGLLAMRPAWSADDPALAGVACPAAPAVQVRAAITADAALACEGAARAWAYLSQARLQLPAQTEVDIVERLPGALHGRALGCYEPDTRHVVLLSRKAFDAAGGWFGLPPDDELYRSAATHELAHAVVGCVALEPALPVPAHEYVAYVVMFATMPPALRARILARYPGRGFDSTLQINSLVYIIDPLQFAADAWRHFLRQADGRAWLRAVVAGEVVQDLPADGP